MKKRRYVWLLLFSAVCSLSLLFAVACSKNSASIEFTDEGGNLTYVEESGWYFADYGTPVTLPNAVVMAEGERTADVVQIEVLDSTGRRIPLMGIAFSPSNGQTYTVTYSADLEGVSDVVITIRCEDNVGPAATFERLQTGAVIGDVIALPQFLLDDPSGVDESKTSVSVKGPSGTVSIDTADGPAESVSTVTGAETFTVTEVGEYTIAVHAADLLGNECDNTLTVVATEPFVDEQIAETNLFDFDESGYERLVYIDEGEPAVSVASADLPAQPDGTASSGGMLKIDLAQDTSARLFFNGFRRINAETDSVGEIYFDVYSTGILAEFTVYGPDGQTVLASKKYRQAGWNTFSFNAKTVLGWSGEFEDFYIGVACEDAVSIYIDGIRYEKLFRDTVLDDQTVADFDEEGYLGLVSQNDYASTAEFSIVTAEDLPGEENEALREGITGSAGSERAGALKVTIDSSMEGFSVLFADALPVSEIGSLTVRMYSDRSYANSRWGFITDTGALTSPSWGDSMDGMIWRNGWADYRFAGVDLENKVSSLGDHIIGFFFAYAETETFSTSVYIDKITWTQRYDPTAEEEYEPYDEDLQLYKLFTFDDGYEMLNNYGVVPVAYPGVNSDAFERREYNGMNALWFASNSGYRGLTYTFPQRLSAYNDVGVMDKGILWVAIAFDASDNYAGASARVCFKGKDASPASDYILFSGLNEGINFLPVPMTDVMALGINSVNGVNVGVSGSNYYMLGVYYDMGVTQTLPETGTSETYKGQTVTVIADMGGSAYLKAFRRTAYSDSDGGYVNLPAVATAEDGSGETLTFTEGRTGAEFRISEYAVGSRGGRVGNILYMDVVFGAAAQGTFTYGVLLSDGTYLAGTVTDPAAGRHSLELYVVDILEIDNTVCAFLFAGDFAAETQVTVDKIYLDAYKEMLDDPALTYGTAGGGTELSWQAVEGAESYIVTLPDGTEQTVSGTRFAVDESGIYEVQAVNEETFSRNVRIYVESGYGSYDADIGGYVLGAFDAAGAETAWAAHTGGVPFEAAVAAPTFGSGSVTSGYNTQANAVSLRTPNSDWSGGYYALVQPLAVSDVKMIGFNIVYTAPWSNCQYNAEFFGVRIGGVDYLADASNAYYRTIRNPANNDGQIIYMDKTAFPGDYLTGAGTNSPVFRVYIDISKINADSGATIEGVFCGLKKANTMYVDSVFYTQTGGTASVTYDGAAMYETYYTNEVFDFSLLGASAAGMPEAQFTFAMSKDGEPFAIPAEQTALEAGSYTVTAVSEESRQEAVGEISFSVVAPQAVTVTLSYGASGLTANDSLDWGKVSVSCGVPDMEFTYSLRRPGGAAVPLEYGEAYTFTLTGTYTLYASVASRGYAGEGETQIEVSAATEVTGSWSVPPTQTYELPDGISSADFAVTWSENVEYSLYIEHGGSSVLFDGDYTFEERGEYIVRAVVTQQGYSGELSVTLAVNERVSLTLLRGGDPLTAFTTTAQKEYDLTGWSVDAGTAAGDFSWTIAAGEGEPAALDMTDTAYTFPANGTYTITVTATSNDYYVFSPVSVTVTVRDLNVGSLDSVTGGTVVADFSNEGTNVQAVLNSSFAFVTVGGRAALRTSHTNTWANSTVRVTLGQPVTLSAGQALFFTVYRPEVNTATGVMYVNGSAYFEVVQSDMPEGWSTFVLTASALAAKASGNTEVSFIDFRTNTAGVDWYYGGIFLVGPGESELPEDAVMLSQRASNISVPSAWGWSGNILTDTAAVNKEGEIWIYYKTTGSGSAYLSLNDYTDGTSRYSSTGIPLSSEWTLLKLKISEVTKPTGTGWGDYFTKNSVDTVEWTTMQVQMADSTSIFSCSWIAYVPPAA